MTIPDNLAPDEHIVLGEDGESDRFEVTLEDHPSRPGVFVHGLTPPQYAPVVQEAEPRGVYRVRKSGSPQHTVDLDERECDCRTRQDGRWCIHLRAAAAYRQQRGEA